MLDLLRPLIGFRPRPYKIAKRAREEEEEEKADDNGDTRSRVRRRDDDGGGGDDDGDDLLSRAFARTREIADLRHAAAKSGWFISVNASAESRRTRGQTERRRVKEKEEAREK